MFQAQRLAFNFWGAIWLNTLINLGLIFKQTKN